MKMAKGSNQAHVVPLSTVTIKTLEELRELTGWSVSLFPNTYGGDKFMSENTIGRMLIRLGYQHRAYACSEHLEERRRMMEDWGTLVDAMEAGDNVVPLARAA